MSTEHEQLGNVVRSSTQRKKEMSDTKRDSNKWGDLILFRLDKVGKFGRVTGHQRPHVTTFSH